MVCSAPSCSLASSTCNLHQGSWKTSLSGWPGQTLSASVCSTLVTWSTRTTCGTCLTVLVSVNMSRCCCRAASHHLLLFFCQHPLPTQRPFLATRPVLSRQPSGDWHVGLHSGNYVADHCRWVSAGLLRSFYIRFYRFLQKEAPC